MTARATAAGALLPGAVLGALFAAPGIAQGQTAFRTRIGDHPAFVRVVVDFRGGSLPARTEMLEATDPEPYADGVARLRFADRGIRTTAPARTAHGVRVTLTQGTNRIAIRLGAPRRRFKYVSYSILHGPERVVIDLWKSAPPTPAAEVRRAPDGCLSLTSVVAGTRTVSASGRSRNLFENSLVVRLRAANGRVLAQRPKTGTRWSTRLRYPRVARQFGTLEAVAASARDGSLDCLVQVRVALR